ncbi:MAG: MFS transporter [Acidimicrobiales bacterium]
MRSDRQVIAFLSFLAVTLAFGIDASLPAFDELRSQFDLGSGSGQVSRVVTAYFLGMAAGQLFWGLLADRFGRRVGIIAGLILYGTGAAGAALAPSFDVLLAARLIWGSARLRPQVLRNSIARDLYAGDRLAHTSLTMAIFLVGPAIAPSVGELILLAGSWRWVFASAVLLAAIGIGWMARFGETLDPGNVRALDPTSIRAGMRAFVTTRATLGYSLAIMSRAGRVLHLPGKWSTGDRRGVRARFVGSPCSSPESPLRSASRCTPAVASSPATAPGRWGPPPRR